MIPTFVLVLHIAAGSFAFLCGAITLSVGKGDRLHRRFGTLFLLAMLIMSVTAPYLSLLRQPGTFFVSLITLYLVVTGWATVRRSEKELGIFEKSSSSSPLWVVPRAAWFSPARRRTTRAAGSRDIPPGSIMSGLPYRRLLRLWI